MLQLLNYTNVRMVEQNAHMTAEMKELAKQNAEQTDQGARQAQSMAILAYDAKRDSEVMKAITMVTLVFLPATFVSVCPMSTSVSGIDHLTKVSFPDNLQYGFFYFQSGRARALSARLDLSCLHLSAYLPRRRRVICVDLVDRKEGREACQLLYWSCICTSCRCIKSLGRA